MFHATIHTYRNNNGKVERFDRTFDDEVEFRKFNAEHSDLNLLNPFRAFDRFSRSLPSLLGRDFFGSVPFLGLEDRRCDDPQLCEKYKKHEDRLQEISKREKEQELAKIRKEQEKEALTQELGFLEDYKARFEKAGDKEAVKDVEKDIAAIKAKIEAL